MLRRQQQTAKVGNTLRGKKNKNLSAMIVIAASAAVCVRTACASEDDESVRFNIEQQYAAAALNLFAEQAGAPILFPFDRVKEIEANALHGNFTLEHALPVLLEGTGLEGTINKRGAIIVSFPAAKLQEQQDVNKKSSLLFSVSALAASAFSGANAQDVADDTIRGDEIIVTAQKRAQSLQDVNAAVSAVSPDALALNAFNQSTPSPSGKPRSRMIASYWEPERRKLAVARSAACSTEMARRPSRSTNNAAKSLLSSIKRMRIARQTYPKRIIITVIPDQTLTDLEWGLFSRYTKQQFKDHILP